jgi:hypothetical protein
MMCSELKSNGAHNLLRAIRLIMNLFWYKERIDSK